MEHFWRDFYSEKHSCFLHVRWACGEETKDKLLEIAGTTHKRLVGPKLSRNTPMWAETQKFNFQSEKASGQMQRVSNLFTGLHSFTHTRKSLSVKIKVIYKTPTLKY